MIGLWPGLLTQKRPFPLWSGRRPLGQIVKVPYLVLVLPRLWPYYYGGVFSWRVPFKIGLYYQYGQWRNDGFPRRSLGVMAYMVATGHIRTDDINRVCWDILESCMKSIPLKRMGIPEEIADLVLFLRSKPASLITGSTIHINGGQWMAWIQHGWSGKQVNKDIAFWPMCAYK